MRVFYNETRHHCLGFTKKKNLNLSTTRLKKQRIHTIYLSIFLTKID